jgi:phytoene dehydrogenase-like protein
MSKVVVIGAGVGGLAVAARLAAAGHQVCVYERAERVGGKLGRHVRHTPHGTFRFDTGPSLLTLPQVFTELFAATGGPAAELDLVELDPVVRHAFADGSTLDSCADPARLAGRIGAAFGEPAAQDWQRLWQRAERVWEASWRDILRKRVDSPLALASLAWRLNDLAAIAPGRTLRGLGRSYLRDPRLRMLLDRYATYTGADPRRAPAALVAIPYAELAFGGWYLRGGLATLADALLRRCLDLGVTVRTGATVTAIDAAGGRVHGVRVEGTPVPADIVVSNVDAQVLYRDLLPNPRRLTTLDDRSLAGFVLLLGVRGRTPGLAHHTVLFPGTFAADDRGVEPIARPGIEGSRRRNVRAGQDAYDAEFDAVFGDPGRGIPARPAPDPTVFVSVADDPSVRPDGYESWFVLVNAARQGRTLSSVDWTRPGLAEAYADRVLDVLAGRGLDIRDRLVFREIRTPADLGRSAAAPGGAIYGTAGHGLLRPANRGPVRGLFLVGGSAHPGGGLPLVALSAEIVAASI